MNILMVTNTFTPHVGGVANSVQAFSEAFRRQGNKVMTIAPKFDGTQALEKDVIRVPAIRHFNGSDFSVALPSFGTLTHPLNEFKPDIVHSHHPYLLGMTAARIARHRQLPLIFTHHTKYEQYTHYSPGDSAMIKYFINELATRYANLADQVIAPSESIQQMLKDRKVTTPIEVIPTGVQLEKFSQGDGNSFRDKLGIPRDVYLVGHLGRLAPEKNLTFLANAVARYLNRNPEAHFLLVGSGPSSAEINAVFAEYGLQQRFHTAGILESQQQLVDAYYAMDVFAFSSTSETQGMVLTEAMATGTPVVALNASGVREVLKDGINGYMLEQQNLEDYVAALDKIFSADAKKTAALKKAALQTATEFSMPKSAEKALAVYSKLCQAAYVDSLQEYQHWKRALSLVKTEWEILEGFASAANQSFSQRQKRG